MFFSILNDLQGVVAGWGSQLALRGYGPTADDFAQVAGESVGVLVRHLPPQIWAQRGTTAAADAENWLSDEGAVSAQDSTWIPDYEAHMIVGTRYLQEISHKWRTVDDRRERAKKARHEFAYASARAQQAQDLSLRVQAEASVLICDMALGSLEDVENTIQTIENLAGQGLTRVRAPARAAYHDALTLVSAFRSAVNTRQADIGAPATRGEARVEPITNRSLPNISDASSPARSEHKPVRVHASTRRASAWEYVAVPLLKHATKQILDQWGDDSWELVTIEEVSDQQIAYLRRRRA